ncbi:undecaprenyl-phosphate glucose phosphotransferase [Thiocapsa sp.]|uniref:undecaprenyl-phosphate glucose phosphotransferase n=1 Tax=Thiocapsa sp. TaxID=2024551 RepID=UPI00261D25F7|nr:undecaprenyl-phosphate glucose phosphotransferase [Thiocapsa sp.]
MLVQGFGPPRIARCPEQSGQSGHGGFEGVHRSASARIRLGDPGAAKCAWRRQGCRWRPAAGPPAHHRPHPATRDRHELFRALSGQIELPRLGLNLVGHPDLNPPADPSTDDRISQATERCIQQIEARVRRGEIDIIYVALPHSGRSAVNELLERLADTTASVYLIPDVYTTSLMHGRWSNLAGIPIVSVYETPFWGVDGWMKRFMDLVLSGILLAVLAIPMALVAAAIKLSSPGPVIFKQRRYGVDGREILVWKFRTMTVCDDGDRFVQATRQDPRVTPIGALLRCTSIDELPQLINVLKGEMSLIGPRPHPIAMNEHYRGKVQGYMLRHKVRPGITGWAQVNGWRGETDTLEKITKRVEHDLWYIQHWSLRLDLQILLMTAIGGFVGRNAY